MAESPAPIVWASLPVEVIPTDKGQLTRRFVHGAKSTVGLFTFAPGTVLAEHAHPNEQFSTVLRGRLRFLVAGEACEVGAGESLHLPSNVSHGAEALEESEVLDVFAPPRTDW